MIRNVNRLCDETPLPIREIVQETDRVIDILIGNPKYKPYLQVIINMIENGPDDSEYIYVFYVWLSKKLE